MINYRVRVYAAKTLVREQGFRGFVLAMDYFQRQCLKFTADEGMCIYLEEREGSEWVTRSHRAGKNRSRIAEAQTNENYRNEQDSG